MTNQLKIFLHSIRGKVKLQGNNIFKFYFDDKISFIFLITKQPLINFCAKNYGSMALFMNLLKVSISQKHFFLKFHRPKNERNIRQNSALESKSGSMKKIKAHYYVK